MSEPLTEQEKQEIERLYTLSQAGDPYALLGVVRQADKNAIRRAYYDLSRRLHPDRFFRRAVGDLSSRLEAAFVGVNEAYALLTDEQQRARFDRRNPDAGASPESTDDQAETNAASGEGASHEVTFGATGAEVRGASASAPSPSASSAPKRAQSKGISRIRQQIAQQIAKARSHARNAEQLASQNNWQAAAPEMYLASRYDPRNEEYKRKAAEYEHKNKMDSANKLIQLAENAESYHNVQSAHYHYKKACDLDPPTGLPFFRLAQVVRLQDGDDREIMRLLRTAVQKDGDNVSYRLGLAEFYVEQGLNANARREYQQILNRDPNNAKAVAGMKKVR